MVRDLRLHQRGNLEILTDEHRKAMREQHPAEVNILIGKWVSDRDIWVVFSDNHGEITHDEIFIDCPDDTKFPKLLQALGCFRSATDAKNNGWNKPIPEGFSEVEVGKAPRLRISILKLTDEKWNPADVRWAEEAP